MFVQMIVNHQVGAGNEAWLLEEQSMLLTAEPSLQSFLVFFALDRTPNESSAFSHLPPGSWSTRLRVETLLKGSFYAGFYIPVSGIIILCLPMC